MPLVLAALPAPGVISYNTKQYLIALWQFWPLNTSIIMWSSKGLIPPAFPFDEEVRWACFFTMLCSLGHKLLLLFYYIGGKSNLLLLLSPPWMESRVLTLEAGVLRFLQWDYILSGSAMWIWAIDLHLMTPECSGNIFFALFAQAWLCFVLGPYGMAVAVYGYASSVMSDSSPYVMSDSGLFVMPGNDQQEKWFTGYSAFRFIGDLSWTNVLWPFWRLELSLQSWSKCGIKVGRLWVFILLSLNFCESRGYVAKYCISNCHIIIRICPESLWYHDIIRTLWLAGYINLK